jgi:hypothetical protein
MKTVYLETGCIRGEYLTGRGDWHPSAIIGGRYEIIETEPATLLRRIDGTGLLQFRCTPEAFAQYA